jgi:hypothetical protein
MANPVLPAFKKMTQLKAALPKLRPLEFVFLFILYEAVDRESGTVGISYEELALLAGCKVRAAQNCIKALEDRECIKVLRRGLGKRRDGSDVFGGEGGKNRYLLVFERSLEKTMEPQRAHGETCSGERTVLHERVHPCVTEGVSADTHTLSLNLSLKYPAAEADDQKWLSVRKWLTKELTADVFEAWFKDVSVVGSGDGIVTLRATTKFHCLQLEAKFSGVVLRGWRTLDPNVTRVIFVHNRTSQ